MNMRGLAFLVSVVGIASFLMSGEMFSRVATAGPSTPQTEATAGKQAPIDEYQRAAQIYYFTNFGAESGPQRGEEIYFYKCWICHNEYTIAANPGSAAPTLVDLYKRPQLLSGKPVNDETVTEKILRGGVAMPSYRYTLSDKDVADLISYLQGVCCWDEENIPKNSRFRAQYQVK